MVDEGEACALEFSLVPSQPELFALKHAVVLFPDLGRKILPVVMVSRLEDSIFAEKFHRPAKTVYRKELAKPTHRSDY